MGTVPDDAPALKHQNARRHADGTETVGHNKRRPSLHQPVQFLLDQGLAFRIKGSGGFIQNQNGSILQEARAIAIRCRWPPDSPLPPSPSMVW